jgi:hypothetical protein
MTSAGVPARQIGNSRSPTIIAHLNERIRVFLSGLISVGVGVDMS